MRKADIPNVSFPHVKKVFGGEWVVGVKRGFRPKLNNIPSKKLTMILTFKYLLVRSLNKNAQYN